MCEHNVSCLVKAAFVSATALYSADNCGLLSNKGRLEISSGKESACEWNAGFYQCENKEAAVF